MRIYLSYLEKKDYFLSLKINVKYTVKRRISSYQYSFFVLNFKQVMKMLKENKYKLYRSLYDIFHPTISRKNISNYDIIIEDSLVPVKVFYPNINTTIEKLMIYIPDQISNQKTYDLLAKNTNQLLLVIHYNEQEKINSCYEVIQYIYHHIDHLGLKKKSITIMSDGKGTNIEQEVIKLSQNSEDIHITKSILLEPRIKKINHNQLLENSLIITQKEFEEEGKKPMINLNDFLKGKNTVTDEYLYHIINQYIN